MDVCYSNSYGTLKQILLFYLNYIVIKIGIVTPQKYPIIFTIKKLLYISNIN